MIFDEDFSGAITIDEYYFALDTYNCRVEGHSPFDKDPNWEPYTHRSIIKFVAAMKERDLTDDEFFRMIDVSNDGFIQIAEMEAVIKIFSDFSSKELHSVYKFFDIDENGVIDKTEYN